LEINLFLYISFGYIFPIMEIYIIDNKNKMYFINIQIVILHFTKWICKLFNTILTILNEKNDIASVNHTIKKYFIEILANLEILINIHAYVGFQ
jgi:hypothetical protein